MPRNEPFYRCPKYSGCAVNDCPLDPEYPRYTDEDDREKTCRLSKDTINLIWDETNLKEQFKPNISSSTLKIEA